MAGRRSRRFSHTGIVIPTRITIPIWHEHGTSYDGTAALNKYLGRLKECPGRQAGDLGRLQKYQGVEKNTFVAGKTTCSVRRTGNQSVENALADSLLKKPRRSNTCPAERHPERILTPPQIAPDLLPWADRPAGAGEIGGAHAITRRPSAGID